MQTIPSPEVLDAQRVDRDDREDMTPADHRDRWQLFATALDESCAYGQRLWDELNDARAYLLRSLPSRADEPRPRRMATRPTGPDDEEGWARWVEAYASITSTLAGPHGDSGWGRTEAHQEVQARRTASATSSTSGEATAAGDDAKRASHEVASSPPPPDSGTNDGPASVLDASPAAAAHRVQDTQRGRTRAAAEVAKPLSLGVLVAFAIRGLRPRRS